ncbi:hypothetical protein [Shewanella sp. Isolate11]|uniref:hypothetical protein n=1 Tax=Shewanella sp. Isolate11 TaxID=2908530 RepID=UPI001EFEE1D5|nr:hypothetical protein [Shewanella sp. Isolate11]MCG9696453.1 hypothetical protein [Shewanella sp. Isolate11]
MFRITIYSIVAYAFWLTFVDVKHFVNNPPEESFYTDLLQKWEPKNVQLQQAEPVVEDIYFESDYDCEIDSSCYSQETEMGE